MRWHPCEVCGRPATIHETAVKGGNVAEHHRCYAHGADGLHIRSDEHQQADFRAMVEQYHRLSDAEKNEIALTYRLNHRLA
jgi:hypothetical protein